MALKRRLLGSQYRFLQFTADSLVHVATITFKDGEQAPEGTLYGIARLAGNVGSASQFNLAVSDITSDGPVTIEAILDPADFVTEGQPSVWQFEIGFSNPDAFNEIGVDWQILVGGVWLRTSLESYLSRTLIASTTIEEAGSS
jgi:hypothetical protein